ncbi:MAG: cell division protein FtsH [Sulfurospirillaceae bacterium]|nr:cell division protein FtsH [Sulfurospirillaceae bacterium]
MSSKVDIDALKAHLKNLPRLSDKDRDARIKKASEDFEYAVQTYFPHHIDYSKKETSKFRKWCYKELPTLLDKEKKIDGEAYRGAAKTTMITRLLTLWQTAIRGKKKHGAIISSTIEVALESLDVIKTELEENENLISDFDIIIGEKLEESWTTGEIVFSACGILIRIKDFGAGKKIRGANWRAHRPDWIVCDDIENDENVENKSQRDKLYKWFIKAIMKLPSRKSTTYNIIYIGTKLHHDSVLSRIQGRVDFVHFSYPLVITFPLNIDQIDKHHLKKSDIKGMVLDDPSLDAMELLKEYLEDKDSFMSEYQNQPLSQEGLTFGEYVTHSETPLCDAYYIGIDPALGKTKGDYFGVTVLGYYAPLKRFFSRTWMYRIKATSMIDKLIWHYKQVATLERPIKIAIEIVQFQEFFKDRLIEKAKEENIHLPVVPLNNAGVPKELRIDSLAPLICDGTISIDEASILLIEELDTYPKAPHDDGLDSLEMAWRIAKKPAFNYEEMEKELKRIEDEEKLLRKIRGED